MTLFNAPSAHHLPCSQREPTERKNHEQHNLESASHPTLKIVLHKPEPYPQAERSTLVQAVGVVLAGLIAGRLSDLTQRRKPFVIGAGCACALGSWLIASATSYDAFLVGMSLFGVGLGGYLSVDFALVTFDVDPGRLAAVLPTGLVPEVRTLDDGRERGFVSAVSFRDVDFRFALAPVVRRSFFQTNYRAYVRGPAGGRAVHFFGTTLDSVWSVIPRRVWGNTRVSISSSFELSWHWPCSRSRERA